MPGTAIMVLLMREKARCTVMTKKTMMAMIRLQSMKLLISSVLRRAQDTFSRDGRKQKVEQQQTSWYIQILDIRM